MANEGTYYGVGLDISGVQKDGQVVIEEFNKIDRAAAAAGKSIDSSSKKMSASITTLEGAYKSARDNFDGTVDDLKKGIELTKQYLTELKLQYRDTLAAVNKTGDPKMAAALRQIKAEIDLEEAALQGLEDRYNSIAGEAAPRFTTQVRQLANEMMALRAEGRQNSEEYRDLEEKMRKLVEVQRQFSIERANMTAGASNMFNGMVNGVQGLMGAYTAASGVAGAFTKDQEKLMAIQTKLQSSMSILMGLQQLSNTLSSTSAFRVTVLTKATQLWHAWNLRTATGLMTMGTSAQFARAATIGLHSALLLLGGAAVIAAIAVISKLTEQQKKAREEQKKWQDEVGQNVSSQLAEYRRLQAEWEKCNGSLEQQKAVVEKNREAWEKLGFEVNDTTTYEKVAVENSEAVVNALIARAKAAAYASLAETKYAKAIQLRLAAENVGTKWWQELAIGLAGSGDEYGNGGASQEVQDAMRSDFIENNRQKLLAEAAQLEKEADSLIQNGIAQTDIATTLLQGLPTIVHNTTGATARTYEEALAEILKQTDNFKKQLTSAQREGIRDAFGAEMDVAKSSDNWETYYRAKRDLAKFNYEQEKADALAAYEATEREVAEKRLEWQKKGWDTSALDQQLQTAADLYNQTTQNIEASYAASLSGIEREEKETNDRITADEQAALKKREQNRIDFLRQYGTFEQKLAATIEDFDRKISEAEDEFEKKTLGAKKADAIMELYRQYSNIYKLIFANVKSLTGSLLGDAIKATQDEINKAIENKASTESLAKLYERLHALQNEQADRNRGWGFVGLAGNIAALDAEVAKGKDADLEKVAVLQDGIEKSFKEIGAAFSELGKELEQFDGALGDIGKTFSAIGDNADTIGKAFSGGFAENTAGAISTAVSGSIQLLGMVLTSIEKNKKAQEEWNLTIEAAAMKYKMLQLDALDYKQKNIFGVENPYKRAIDGALQYGSAMEALNEQVGKLAGGQVQTGTKKVVDWGNVGKGAAIGTAAGAAVGSIIPGIGTAIGAAVGAAIGLVTGAIAGLASTKIVPVFESLSQHYGQIFNPETYELNERILADYDKLDDATKQIVDNWQDIADKAKEAEQQMRENFSDLSGDLGDKLKSSLVAAFKNGELYGAIDDFHGKMTSTIEDIVSSLVFSSVFSDMFTDLESDFMASFKGPNADNNIVDDLMRFSETYKQGLADYDEQMKAAQAYLRSQGYDVWQSDQRTAQTRTGITATQDSVNEGNARLTTIQSHTFELKEDVREIKSQHAAVVQNTAAILEHVQGIHSDTNDMRQTLSEVKTLAGHIKSGVGTIIDSGVKIK